MKSTVAVALIAVSLLCTQTHAQNNRVSWYTFSGGFAASALSTTRVESVVGQQFIQRTGSGDTWVAGGFLADTLLRGTVTGVQEQREVPGSYALEQNYPNPFNPSTTIRFALPAQGHATLVVHNILGQRVRTLVDEEKSPGVYSVTFGGEGLASGVYFYTLRAGSFSQTRKLMILR